MVNESLRINRKDLISTKYILNELHYSSKILHFPEIMKYMLQELKIKINNSWHETWNLFSCIIL